MIKLGLKDREPTPEERAWLDAVQNAFCLSKKLRQKLTETYVYGSSLVTFDDVIQEIREIVNAGRCEFCGSTDCKTPHY